MRNANSWCYLQKCYDTLVLTIFSLVEKQEVCMPCTRHTAICFYMHFTSVREIALLCIWFDIKCIKRCKLGTVQLRPVK